LTFTAAEKENDRITTLFSENMSDDFVIENVSLLMSTAKKFMDCTSVIEVYIDKVENDESKIVWINRLKYCKSKGLELMKA